jgi:Ima1 N-terminal domain
VSHVGQGPRSVDCRVNVEECSALDDWLSLRQHTAKIWTRRNHAIAVWCVDPLELCACRVQGSSCAGRVAGMFRRREQKRLVVCFFCNTPSTVAVDRHVPLRKWHCSQCEQTNHLDEVPHSPPKNCAPNRVADADSWLER